MWRRRGWIGLAALVLLGGCAQAVPPPAASTPAVRTRSAVRPTRGFDCTTHNYGLFTTSNCGDGGFQLYAPATE